MKKIFFILTMACSAVNASSQNAPNTSRLDSVFVDNRVEFFTYDGPYGDQENVKLPAIKFILTVHNKGTKPIPDLGVSNRSKHVNLYINDSLNNPVSLYNGLEAMGEHLINPKEVDTYTWWFPYEKDEAYGNVFTVHWQYMELFSKKIRVNMTQKTSVFVE